MKKAITIILLLVTLAAVIYSTTKGKRDLDAKQDLYLKTSDAAKITQTVTIAGDDWLGYAVCRSPRFAQLLAQDGIGAKFDMVFDFAERVEGLASGKYQFATITLDSYLSQGEKQGWPGVALWVIDESYGGDAIVGTEALKTVDDLNNATGAFTAGSPSEFLLRSQVTHFQLENLRKNLDKFAAPSIEDAYKALKSGKAQFAVLWEPLKTKALQEIPGSHVIIDTKQAQGLIIDIFLASRTQLTQDPATVQKVAKAYFTVLHEWMNSPAKFAEAALRDINARDHKKTMEDAEEMLKGIRFASLPENQNEWLCSTEPKLATAITQVSRILDNQGTTISLPNGDPNAILFKKASQAVQDAPALLTERPHISEYYKPLSTTEWETLSKKIKGTLLDTPIIFRPGQSEIPEETQEELKEAVPKLAHYPGYRVIIEAHSYGNPPEVDQQLSEERAAEVKRFLTWECSLPDERILAVGKGSIEPLTRAPDENDNAFARRNRRAKVLLVGE